MAKVDSGSLSFDIATISYPANVNIYDRGHPSMRVRDVAAARMRNSGFF